MIYTSYYANLRNIPINITRIIISVTHPEWLTEESSEKLEWDTVYPPEELLWNYKAGKVSNEEYTERYIRHLNDNFDQIKDEFSRLPRDAVLLCWCGSKRFCHRHILADWINTYLKPKNKVIEYE